MTSKPVHSASHKPIYIYRLARHLTAAGCVYCIERYEAHVITVGAGGPASRLGPPSNDVMTPPAMTSSQLCTNDHPQSVTHITRHFRDHLASQSLKTCEKRTELNLTTTKKNTKPKQRLID